MEYDRLNLFNPSWTVARFSGRSVICVESATLDEEVPTRLAVSDCQPCRLPPPSSRLPFSAREADLADRLLGLSLQDRRAPLFNPLTVLAAHRFVREIAFEAIDGLHVSEPVARVLRAMVRVPNIGVISAPWLASPLPVVALSRMGSRLSGVTLQSYVNPHPRAGTLNALPALTPLSFPDRALQTTAAIPEVSSEVGGFD